MNISYLNPNQLKPHEKTSLTKCLYVFIKVMLDGGFILPIVVDQVTNTILDGHHRVAVAKFLNLNSIPALLVDYMNDPEISVLPRRKDISVSKEKVISTALSNNRFPHKTTKHVFANISIQSIYVPLTKLHFQH